MGNVQIKNLILLFIGACSLMACSPHTNQTAQRPIRGPIDQVEMDIGTSCILSEGKVYCSGMTQRNQIGAPFDETEVCQSEIPGQTVGCLKIADLPVMKSLSPNVPLDNVKFIRSGVNTFAAVTHDGELYMWGSNNWGKLMAGIPFHVFAFNEPRAVKIEFPVEADDLRVVDVASNLYNTCAIVNYTAPGTNESVSQIYCSGINAFGTFGKLFWSNPNTAPPEDDYFFGSDRPVLVNWDSEIIGYEVDQYKTIVADGGHFCFTALARVRDLYDQAKVAACWGADDSGQTGAIDDEIYIQNHLGQRTTIYRSLFYTSLPVLGIEGFRYRMYPELIRKEEAIYFNAISVHTGRDFSCLKYFDSEENTRLACWGANNLGQLGLGYRDMEPENCGEWAENDNVFTTPVQGSTGRPGLLIKRIPEHATCKPNLVAESFNSTEPLDSIGHVYVRDQHTFFIKRRGDKEDLMFHGAVTVSIVSGRTAPSAAAGNNCGGGCAGGPIRVNGGYEIGYIKGIGSGYVSTSIYTRDKKGYGFGRQWTYNIPTISRFLNTLDYVPFALELFF